MKQTISQIQETIKENVNNVVGFKKIANVKNTWLVILLNVEDLETIFQQLNKLSVVKCHMSENAFNLAKRNKQILVEFQR
jgi:hypothetical protein